MVRRLAWSLPPFGIDERPEYRREGLRTIKTSRFGTLSIPENSVITFTDGIIGFPRLREFAVLGIEDYLPFLIFASLDNPRICFPIISPTPLFPKYDPMAGLLGVDDLIGEEKDAIQVYCLVAFVDRPRRPVVNLRNPLVVDVRRMTGAHISLANGKYNPRTPVNLGEILLRTRLRGGS
jgi:flagellar assembly factor FliW